MLVIFSTNLLLIITCIQNGGNRSKKSHQTTSAVQANRTGTFLKAIIG